MRGIGLAVVVTVGLFTLPLAAAEGLQPIKVPRLGILSMATSEDFAPYRKALDEALQELGYIPGKTLLLEQRNAANQQSVSGNLRPS